MEAKIFRPVFGQYRSIRYRCFEGIYGNWKWSIRFNKSEDTVGGDAPNQFLAERIARAKIDERLSQRLLTS